MKQEERHAYPGNLGMISRQWRESGEHAKRCICCPAVDLFAPSRRVHLNPQRIPDHAELRAALAFWAEAHTVGKSANPADLDAEKPPQG